VGQLECNRIESLKGGHLAIVAQPVKEALFFAKKTKKLLL
jgi:hypothetical protein